MEVWVKLTLLCGCCFGAIADFDGRWPRQMASSNGLCRYGARIDCCWGWTRRSWGHCQPLCPHGCKHGECVGPDKCKCFPGYTGKTCNQDEQEYVTPPVWDGHPPVFFPVDLPPAGVLPPQDLNECGLKPRPCKHRCMNTYGSYKCYCLNGYMLLPDGSCGNARTCGMANCQYGCEVMKGEVRCQCPAPGLQLGPDGRTCVDVDECAAGRVVCPRFRKCVNTFGSYICKCHDGFELQYINGKYQCTDVDECATGQHHCFRSSVCYNTPGSYKCKCKDGFRGIGYDCKPIPKVSIDPPRPGKNPPNNKIPDYNDKKPPNTVRPPATPKLITTTTTSTPSTTKKRIIPTPKPPIVTVRPAVPTQKPVVPTRRPPTPTLAPTPPRKVPVPPTRPAPTPKSTTVDNSIQNEVTSKPRGDVHIPRNQGQNNVLGFDYDIELGNTAEEAHDDPDAGFLSCTFDDGICSWISDKEGDQHWETTEDPSGGKYLTIPEVWGRRSGRGARLVIPLVAPWDAGDLCLSFRHKLSGHHVGVLQVFLRKAQQHSPAVWGRTGGHGWRHTQITLWGVGLESVILKGERGRNRSGEIALDDISLRRGACTEEHSPRRL
ncbi:nephronectin a isoform X2 [Brienomyrus brachyistius]|uniref:nephronectin a isoform X2 n=1 Tax=Brienomyrus brachyistius TaxID=42636 RepID=UPI0020B406EF|nr:nephronectin a isoform X2 [Brienomyrus brachyistius]